MKRSLALKLTAAFLVVSLAGIAISALVIGIVTATQFNNYVDAQNQNATLEQLAINYSVNGGWDALVRRFETGNFGGGAGNNNQRREQGLNYVLADAQGVVLVPGQGYHPGDVLRPEDQGRSMPIEADGAVVGLMLPGPGRFGEPPPRTEFIEPFYNALVMGGAVAAAASLLLGIVLARSLVRPLRELTGATQAVAAGEFGKQVDVLSEDELGELALSFNRMSADLERSHELRRQMTADIAHDLRTPLSIILGHAEGIVDGVIPASAESLDIIYDEARRLNRLIEDLRVLSLSDANELSLSPQLTEVGVWLERVAAAHRPQALHKQITLEVDASADLPPVGSFEPL